MTDTTDHRHWQRINALLEIALNLPREEREGWLKALPPDDAALAPKLKEMLARSGDQSDAFLGGPVAAGVLAEAMGDAMPQDHPGDVTCQKSPTSNCLRGGGAYASTSPTRAGRSRRCKPTAARSWRSAVFGKRFRERSRREA